MVGWAFLTMLYSHPDELAAASGQDDNSISTDPLLVNPNGTSETLDLHLQSGSSAIGAGTAAAVATNDFDDQNREPCKTRHRRG